MLGHAQRSLQRRTDRIRQNSKKKSKKNSKNLTISKNPTQSQDIKLYKGNNRLRHPKIKKTRAVEFTIVHASAGLKAPQKNSNILKKNKTLKT